MDECGKAYDLNQNRQKCPSLNKHNESNFNPDQTKLKMTEKIEHIAIHMKT